MVCVVHGVHHGLHMPYKYACTTTHLHVLHHDIQHIYNTPVCVATWRTYALGMNLQTPLVHLEVTHHSVLVAVLRHGVLVAVPDYLVVMVVLLLLMSMLMML